MEQMTQQLTQSSQGNLLCLYVCYTRQSFYLNGVFVQKFSICEDTSRRVDAQGPQTSVILRRMLNVKWNACSAPFAGVHHVFQLAVRWEELQKLLL